MNVYEVADVDEFIGGVEGLTDFEPWTIPSWFRDRWAAARPQLIQSGDGNLTDSYIARYLAENRIWEWGTATICGEPTLLIYCDRFDQPCLIAGEHRCGIQFVQSETPQEQILAYLTEACVMSRPLMMA